LPTLTRLGSEPARDREGEPHGRTGPRRIRSRSLVLGSVLIIVSVVGFATVADDLRHVGELLAVTSIVIAGLALVVASFPNPASRNLSLPWVAAGSLVGSLAGAATDHMAIGVGGGVVLGCILAATIRPRASR